MRLKKVYFLLSILIQMFVITSLVTGSPILSTLVVSEGSLAWGNLMTAVLFLLFPLNFMVIRSSRKVHQVPLNVFRFCVLVSLLLGLFWLPVTYWLSGNWSASFTGQDGASKFWWLYTYTTPILPFAGYFLMRFLSVFYKR